MDIKNIIKKAYLDGIIEGQVIAKVNMNFDTEGMSEHYAETELKKLRVGDVMPRFLKTKYTLEELDQYVMELSARTDKYIHRGKLEDIEKLIRWRRRYDALNGA